MVEPGNTNLSIGKQCKLLSISRSSFYYMPKGETAMNLMLMRQIDEQFLETPFFGVRQMTWHLRNEGLDLSRFDAAPLIAFTATKEMNYGTETDGRISPGCGADSTDQWANAQSGS